ncbi:MAG TPA: hypothetical protein VER26_06025 [Xanthobacteraceae bacterium]|jgi:hypothetical protein|nr:hypothetical protein [Xanthobacteraceae bacterium]
MADDNGIKHRLEGCVNPPTRKCSLSEPETARCDHHTATGFVGIWQQSKAAGSGGAALAEKRAAEEDRSLASYISQLIVGDAEKKGRP